MKRVLFIYIFLITFLIIFIALLKNDVILTTSTSIERINKVIVLDAGHGGEDGGAVSKSGILEKDLNLVITLKLKDLLEKENFIVILTREDDRQLYSSENGSVAKKKTEDINKRIEIVNGSNADILISIHMNSFPQSYCNGWQTFYSTNSIVGKQIAENIQKSIGENVLIENKRIAKTIEGIKLVRNTKIPAVIVECGFLSNEEEASRLNNEEYQNKIAKGICEGIIHWYNTIE